VQGVSVQDSCLMLVLAGLGCLLCPFRQPDVRNSPPDLHGALCVGGSRIMYDSGNNVARHPYIAKLRTVVANNSFHCCDA
jgi:hypothetical protein